MSHLVRNEHWGVVDLDPDGGRVFVREDWRYDWVAEPPMPPWTDEEKRAYHRKLDRSVWAQWSQRVTLRVDFASFPEAGQLGRDLVKRHSIDGLSLSFDVRWVSSASAHWFATVAKANPLKEKPQAQVWVETGRMNLFDIDVNHHAASRYKGDPKRRPNFIVSPHEFGHTLGNRDEYRADSAHYGDVASIMNIGRGLRTRHLNLIVRTLGRMVLGCRFTPTIL